MSGFVCLGDVITLEYGRSLPAAQRRAGNVPVYGSNGITGWHDEALVGGPVIVVGRKGSIGEVQYEPGPAFPIDTTYYALPKPGVSVDFRYLFYMLRVARLTDLNSATGVPGLNREHAYRVPTKLPPLDEQRRIVGLLDRAAEIRRRADATRAKARAIIPALFLDTFGDPATNPKGWPVVTLGDLHGMELRNGISPSKAGKVSGNVLTLSAITRGQFDPSARKDAMFAGPLAAEHTVSKSLFLICRGNGNRALVGQGAFPLMDMPGVAFPDTMIALRLPEHEVAPPYLAAVWSSEHVRAQIDAAAKTTNGTFKISQSGILRFSFPLPPRPLQISFGERVSRLETLARNLDAAAAKAEAMAAGLSAEVFG